MTSSEPAVPQPVGISPRAVDRYELSRTQQQIWTSQRLDPGSPVANMGKRHRIAGAIDAERFVSAFDDVVRASDALRTVIVDERDRSLGRVLAAPPERTEVIDLDLDDLDEWCRLRIGHAIDATQCSYDSVLLRHAADDWTWWLDLHHVVTDAAGSAAVYRITSDRYEALTVDEVSGPIELPSFAEHVARIEQAATSDRGAARRAARIAEWDRRAAVSDPPPLSPFGVRSVRTSSSTRLPIDVPLDALAAAIEGPYRTLTPELSTLAVLASAAAVVTHRLDGRDSCSIGVPVHHRSGPVAPNVIGPLMELYPVVVSIGPDDTFQSLVQRTLAQVLDVLGRARPGESPTGDYEIVVNVVTGTYRDFAGKPTVTTWERSSHVDPAHPLRLHAFDYSSADGPSADGPSADGSGSQQSSNRFEVDISAMLADDDAAGRLSQYLSAAVSTAVNDPELPLGSFNMLSVDEIAQLAQLNPVLVTDQLVPVPDQIGRSLSARPDEIVVASRAAELTASEFDDQVARSVSWLRALGVEPGDRVGIRMSRSVDALVAIHAVHRCGAAFVMLDPDDPSARHVAVSQDAELRLIVDTIAPALARDFRDVHDPAPASISLDDLAYVLYTSGSTGAPKGVPISHRGLADYLHFAVDAYTDPGAGPPVVALHSSMVFDLTITSLFLSFLTEGQVVVVDGEPVDALGQIAVDNRITFVKATPSQLDLLTRLAVDQRPLRTIVVGGEAFRRPTALAVASMCAPGVRIFNEYGPTEAVVGCMIHEWDESVDTGADVPIGHAAPGCEIAVLDAAGRPSAAGSWGELFVRRCGMATAYLNRPELSAERFVRLTDVPGASADTDRGPWYRTGDRLRIERPGVATYGGRMDDQLKVNGIRLEPGEVEAVLVEHPRVASAIVRQWTPADRAAAGVERCVRCGLGIDVPGIALDVDGVCSTCRQFEAVEPQADVWFRDENDLDERLAEARRRSTGDYDCLHLLSGGKDSSYALYQLVERGWRVHALTLDNGFISEGAKENVRRSIADLGITHEFATTDAMNAIFRDSLDRYSNVCQGCYKTIYTLAVARAKAMGIPVIVTGLSRGQFFETRLIPAQFDEGRFDPDAIDATVLEARKVYHQTPDAVTKMLPEQEVFATRPDGGSVLDEIEFVDFYRYVDVDLAELYRYLENNAPWVRPADTGRSTNCLINVAGIQVHRAERGYHNYAEPYSWDVRLGHKTRDEALEELDDVVDDDEVVRLLGEIAYEPKQVQVLTAWYQSVDGEDIDPAELRRHARQHLADHAVPVAFVRLDEMPLAASAKVDVAALPAPTRLHRSGHDVVTADTITQRVICDVWADVLQLEQVGITDDFFDLGGDSLAALEVVATLAERFDVELPDAAVFRHRTVAELADLVDGAADDGDAVTIPSLPADQPLPLSAGEEAMLFEYRIDPLNTRYNITRLYTLAESVDVDRLRRAVTDVVMLHQPLHTSYSADRHALSLDQALLFETIEVTDFRAFAMEQRGQPFDLDQGPLVRVHTATSGDETSVLIGMHHINIDAVTFDVFWNQVATRYGVGDDMGDLPALAVTHAEHADWQRGVVDVHADYWAAERAAADASGPVGRLAVAAPSPVEPDGYIKREIDLTVSDVQGGPAATTFVAALTAAAATVSRFSGSSAVELGISMSVKDHAAAAPLVGYHLNTLPIRLDIDPAANLRGVAGQANSLVAAAIEHRTYPFASIVRDARAAGQGPPDVSCMLAYQTLADSETGALAASHEILASGTSIADVTFYVQERVAGIGLGVEYRGEVVSHADAVRLLDTFATLLIGAAASPDASFADLAPVDGGDIVGDALEAGPTVLQSIVEHARLTPDAEAVRDATGRSLTYAELLSSAMGIADDIAALDPGTPTRPTRFVGIAVRRSVDVLVAAVGTHLAGAAYVPLDPTSPAQRLAQIIGAARPDVLITDPQTIAAAIDDQFEDALVIRPDRPIDPAATERAQAIAEAQHADDAAYVIFTSGSTGVPRGVAVSHANLAASTTARAGFYRTWPERFLVTSSIGFDSSIVGLFWPLATGGTVVLPADDDVGDVDRLIDLIEGERISHLLMVPSLYRAVVARGSGRLGQLDTAIVAGEACPTSLVDAHFAALGSVNLVNEYGPTEATVWATAHRCVAGESVVPIGRPIPGVTVRVADEAFRSTPIGVAGELLVAGPTVTSGYLDDDAATALKFVDVDGRRWYRTGDLVRSDVDGVVTFLGRVDDQLNVGGVRLEPSEVEAALGAHPAVIDAVVVASSGGRPQLIAHVETAHGTSIDEAAFRRSLADVLPATHVPARIVSHAALPRTSHGKVDRRVAAELDAPSSSRAAAPAPETNETLHTVMAAWSDALGRTDLGADSDYFASGGDSLAAVEIVTIIGDRLDRDVPIAALLTGRTPAGMAEIIDRSRGVRPSVDMSAGEQLVVFREGTTTGPLVVMTTGWDDVFGYQSLAQALPDDVTVLALSTAAAASGAMISTIDELAMAFCDTLSSNGWLDVERPITLVGWSTGGVVAYDAAKRLRTDGADVRRIVLVDSYFPGAEQHMWANRWSKYKSLLQPSAFGELLREAKLTVHRRARSLAAGLGRRLLAWSGSPVPEAPKTTSVGGVPIGAYQYRPEPTDIDVVIYAASETNRDRTVNGWIGVVPDIEVVPVDGRHRGYNSIMNEDRVGLIAADLGARFP